MRTRVTLHQITTVLITHGSVARRTRTQASNYVKRGSGAATFGGHRE